MSAIAFRPGRGAEAMQAAAAEAEASKGNFRRAQYFGLKNGEKAILRFITPVDEIPFVRYHNFVPIDPSKAKNSSSNSSMSAACRRDKAFVNEDGTPAYPDCWICDTKVTNSQGKICKPTPKMLAIACLRMEYQGKIIDTPRDVKIIGDDGKEQTRQERALVVVAMAPSNFWDFIIPLAGRTGTLSDRDFEIMRQGDGLATKYVALPFDPDPNHHPGTDSWDDYAKAMKTQDLDVDDIVIKQSSDEYYARFFDPRFTVTEDGKVVPTGTGAPTAATAQSQAQAESDFARKIRELRGDTAPAAAAPAPAAAMTGDPWATGTGDYAPAF